ncbi:hypothetical protein TNCV_3776621 [Trichonephila clavipes]|nr:hypothetical protein TNCV_3776621 [Trichonephila clavipes]
MSNSVYVTLCPDCMSRFSGQIELAPEPDKTVYLARQISVEVDSDDVQELQGYNNQELTMDELLKIHEPGKTMKNLSL